MTPSRFHLRHLALFPLLILAHSARALADDGDSSFALVGVDVISMTERGLLSNQTVLVRAGLIASMGPAAQTAVPPDALAIDGTGRVLMPGLADLHVHLEHFDDPAVLALLVAQGVTTVRNMDGRPYLLDWRDRVASGDLLGPRIVTAGPILDGDPPLRDDNLSLSGPKAARAAVREQAARGYDFVKVYTNLSRRAYAAVAEEAAAQGLPMAGHLPRGVDLERAMTAGHASVEHLDGYDELIESDDSPWRDGWHWTKLYLAMPIDSSRVASAARRTAEGGIWNVPTLVVKEKLAPIETVREWLAAPEMAYVPAAMRASWAPESWPGGLRSVVEQAGPDDWALFAEGRTHRLAMVRALHEAGAGLLAGTDMPNAFVVPGMALHEELALLVEAGLEPEEALAAATSRAAEFFDESGRWGVVAAGARADLLLLDANPLEDIHNTRRIVGVSIAGRWLDGTRIEALRSDVVSAYAE